MRGWGWGHGWCLLWLYFLCLPWLYLPWLYLAWLYLAWLYTEHGAPQRAHELCHGAELCRGGVVGDGQ